MVTYPVLLIGIPLLIAFIIPLVKKYGSIISLGTLAFNTLIAIEVFFHVYSHGKIYETIAGFNPPLGIFLAIDGLSALVALIINLFAFINFFGIARQSDYKFSMLYLLAVAGSTGIVLTGDIFNMFVFFEITAVASYALVASRKDEKAVEGAIKYMILGSIASTFILIGIAIIYNQLKSLNIYDVAIRIGSMDTKLMLTSFAFLLTGIGVEAELFPLNGWVPSAYQGAKASIASLLSFAPSKAAIYAIARIIMVIFPYQHACNIALITGIITLLIGEFAAFMQEDIKRMLAYSSIGQMGLILIAISLAGNNIENALPAIFFLIVGHASSKASLFLLSEKNDGGKLARYTMVMGVLGIIGMPPFASFWGKWYLLLASMSEDLWIVIILIFLSAIVEAGYFAKYMSRQKYGNELRMTYKVAMAVMVTFSLLFGILPLLTKIASLPLWGGV